MKYVYPFVWQSSLVISVKLALSLVLDTWGEEHRIVLGGLPEEKHGKSGRGTENKSKVQREWEIVSNRVSIARTLREKKDWTWGTKPYSVSHWPEWIRRRTTQDTCPYCRLSLQLLMSSVVWRSSMCPMVCDLQDLQLEVWTHIASLANLQHYTH